MPLKDIFFRTDGQELPAFEREIRTTFDTCRRNAVQRNNAVMIIALLVERDGDGHKRSNFGTISNCYDPEEVLQRLDHKKHKIIAVFDLTKDFDEQWPSELDGKIHTPEDLAKSPINNLPDYNSANVVKLNDFKHRRPNRL